MPLPRWLAFSISAALAVAGLTIRGLTFADGQLPPPPPPPGPGSPSSPADARPPVVAPAPTKSIPADAPKAVLDRSEQDWGVSKQEAELKTEFRLSNEGKSALTLELRADCGCSAAIADVKSLEPGRSTPIRVHLRTFSYVGPTTKHIKVLTNDPIHPMLEIRLRTDISAGVVVDPARFYFGFVEVGTAPSLTIKVQWKDGIGSPFEITSSEIPGLDLDVATKKFDATPWHGYEVTATFRKPPAIGTVSGTAVLRTNSADTPRITAAVTAFVSGRIWLDKREISLGMLPQGKERSVMIGCRGLKPDVDLGLVTAKSRNGRVAVKAVRAQDKEWLIEIRSLDGAAVGRLDDVIEVTSSLVPETAEIAVKGEILAKRD